MKRRMIWQNKPLEQSVCDEKNPFPKYIYNWQTFLSNCMVRSIIQNFAHPLHLRALSLLSMQSCQKVASWDQSSGADRAPASGQGGRAAPLPAYIEDNVSSFALALMIFEFFSRCVTPSGSVVKCWMIGTSMINVINVDGVLITSLHRYFPDFYRLHELKITQSWSRKIKSKYLWFNGQTFLIIRYKDLAVYLQNTISWIYVLLLEPAYISIYQK